MSKQIISPDQNTIEFNSKTFQFKASKDNSDGACDLCELHHAEACEAAPCMPKERTDSQNGFFELK